MTQSFLGVSVGPGAASHLCRPHAGALACLGLGIDEDIRSIVSPDGWFAFAASDGGDIVEPASGRFTVRLGQLARTRDRDVGTAELADLLRRESDLAALTPPFAAAHRGGHGEPALIAGDWLGFRQLYWWSGDGAAAVSTSARALAVLAGSGLDSRGVGAQAMIGWQVGDLTPFDGVRAVPPGTLMTLERGLVRPRRYVQPFQRPGKPPELDDAVAEMAEILSVYLSSYVDSHPDAVLQLTGGHDSRILLAAIPARQRRGLRALTLGDPSSPDVVVAAHLSELSGIRHHVHRLDQQVWPTPPEAHALAMKAAHALEYQASPLALAPLLLVEDQLEQGHRLSGLGGEVARGFYYAGQPKGGVTSERLVERLARWRLFSNESVEPAALDADFLREARIGTLETLSGLFEPGDWLRATDEFYLYHRMHRWAGVHGTVAAVRRHYVNPMFDRRFVELALAVAPDDKRDSLLLGRLMRHLDPDLARIPLDTGLVPARLGTRALSTTIANRTLTARKAARKVRQRLSRSRRPQLGAAHMSDLVLTHWRATPDVCGPLYEMPWLNAAWLDGLIAGQHAAEPTTMAFLINVLATRSGGLNPGSKPDGAGDGATAIAGGRR